MTTITSRRPRERYIPIDERAPSDVRALILARTSDPSGNAADVESQVTQSLDFIAQMRWKFLHPDDPYRYTETKTGMRQVRRPVLDTVLAMAQRHEVDVIVCLAPARIDRKKLRRYQAIQTALDFGVEFRFAKRASEQGKYPGGVAGLLEQLKDDLYDEEEAKQIKDRLSPGKELRYKQGLPHGGKNGPNYGYVEGQRRYKEGALGRPGRQMGVLTWEVDEPRARWVRWLYQQADDLPVGELSLRKLAHELDVMGAPPPLAKTGWSRTAVSRILTNPKYAGKGRNLTTEVYWQQETDPDTGRVYEVPRLRKRAGDTYAIPTSAIPPLVSAEQFERVQAKLKDLKEHHRSAPRLGDGYVPLFDAGLAHCAHCDGWMSRWRMRSSPALYYRCNRRSTVPNHPCAPAQVIPARAADTHALVALAKALTNPEQILRLADAAEQQHADAETERALAESSLAAAMTRLDELATERAAAEKALAGLSALDGMERAVADVRARILALDAERTETLAITAQGGVRRDRATERAAFLRQMFTTRKTYLFRIEDDGAITFPRPDEGERYVHIPSTLSLREAAALLDVAEADVPRWVRDVATVVMGEDEETGEWITEMETIVETWKAVYAMLRGLGRERLRHLMYDLKCVILVSRPRPRSQWATRGKTPPAERITLRLMETVDIDCAERTNVSK